MDKMNVNTMELGNLIFGNSRGNFHIADRQRWEKMFNPLLCILGMTSQVEPFENDVFIIRPYYWGMDDNVAILPNFEFKPWKFNMSWYKYPLRDAYVSHDISIEEFNTIIQKCVDSVKNMTVGELNAIREKSLNEWLALAKQESTD